jgi:uncharacterized protein with GYD domain
LIFIILGKYRKKPTKETFMKRQKETDTALEKAGGKRLGSYLTFGRYDYVTIVEHPDPKLPQTMKRAIDISDDISSETLVAVKSEEVLDLL